MWSRGHHTEYSSLHISSALSLKITNIISGKGQFWQGPVPMETLTYVGVLDCGGKKEVRIYGSLNISVFTTTHTNDHEL